MQVYALRALSTELELSAFFAVFLQGIQVPLAFYILQNPEFWNNKLRAHNPESFTLMILSAGYFLHDFVHSVIHVKEEGVEYVFHGGASLFVYLGALLFNPPAFHFYGAGFILWEVSSCFLHFGK